MTTTIITSMREKARARGEATEGEEETERRSDEETE
jgi:hypothetical protein